MSMGVSLLETTTDLTFSHCNLALKTLYSYILITRNAAGYSSASSATFQTGNTSDEGEMTLSSATFDEMTAKFSISLSCEVSSTLNLYYELYDEMGTALQSGQFECCQLSIEGLISSNTYNVSVGLWIDGTGVSAAGFFRMANTLFSAPLLIPLPPSTRLQYATSSELRLTLVPPTNVNVFKSSGLTVNAIVSKISSGAVVFEASLDCTPSSDLVTCPDSLLATNLPGSTTDSSYMVSVKSISTYGDSDWDNKTFEVDVGQTGTIGFAKTEYRNHEGDQVWIEVGRFYGTTTAEDVTFQIDAVQAWSCVSTGYGTSCTTDPTGSNSGMFANYTLECVGFGLTHRLHTGELQFGIGSYTSSIYISLPYDISSGNESRLVNITLLSATSSDLGVTSTRIRYVQDAGDIISFETTQLSVVEDIGSITVGIIRAGGISGSVDVRVKSSRSSALTSGTVNKLVSFADQEWRTTVSLAINNFDEFGSRAFELSLWNTSSRVPVSSTNLTVNVLDKGDISIPAYPTFSVSVVTGGQIEILLSQNRFTGGDRAIIEKYAIKIRSSKNTTVTRMESLTPYISASGLDDSTLYEISASVKNQRGWSEYSPIQAISTEAPSNPGALGSLRVMGVTGGAVQLQWTDPTDSGGSLISSYSIGIENTATGEFRLSTIPAMSKKSTALIGDLLASTIYQFHMAGRNQAGLEGEVKTVVAETLSALPPTEPPAPSKANATGGMLYLDIIAPTDCGGAPLISYTLYMARLVAGDLTFRTYTTEDVHDTTSGSIVGTVGVRELLANSVYVFRVTLQNAQVSLLMRRIISQLNYTTNGWISALLGLECNERWCYILYNRSHIPESHE